MSEKSRELYPPEEFEQALKRLHELQEQHFVFISDGSPGGNKVAEALQSHRTLLPALETLLKFWSDELMNLIGLYPEQDRWVIADKMLELARAINTLPREQSPDRLRAAFDRISGLG